SRDLRSAVVEKKAVISNPTPTVTSFFMCNAPKIFVFLCLFVAKQQLHRQTFKTHDCQRVGCRTWSRSQAVVKNHAAIVHLLAKMKVCNSVNLQLDQLEIVSRNQTD